MIAAFNGLDLAALVAVLALLAGGVIRWAHRMDEYEQSLVDRVEMWTDPFAKTRRQIEALPEIDLAPYDWDREDAA